jgi:hypothetical protein
MVEIIAEEPPGVEAERGQSVARQVIMMVV